MADLRPLGSERLEGIDKLKRIMEIARYNEVPKNEINEKEEYYIKILKSLTPNGYNLKSGGDKGKDSDETKQKKKEAHTGMEHSEKTKESISKGQLGNRRNSWNTKEKGKR